MTDKRPNLATAFPLAKQPCSSTREPSHVCANACANCRAEAGHHHHPDLPASIEAGPLPPIVTTL